MIQNQQAYTAIPNREEFKVGSSQVNAPSTPRQLEDASPSPTTSTASTSSSLFVEMLVNDHPTKVLFCVLLPLVLVLLFGVVLFIVKEIHAPLHVK